MFELFDPADGPLWNLMLRKAHITLCGIYNDLDGKITRLYPVTKALTELIYI